ncbi:cyanophycinase [Adhaeribacter aquaticus]|uniref:cyanophycinase n=1 Tax=Adhaeribacter aquaticus TaxID=299567 RepID=UPI00040AD5AC|nr:cyanophycinase [Adhaeribacter aquaticus]
MKQIRFIFLLIGVCLLLFSFSGLAQNITKKKEGKLFIMGGGTRPAALINRMIEEAGLRNNGYAFILPMASTEVDSAIQYSIKQLRDNGITKVSSIRVVPEKPLRPSLLDSLENAALIYIPGGDQNLFMQAIETSGIAESIRKSYRNGNLIAGTSAGAALMSEHMITGVEKKYNTETSANNHSEFSTIEAMNIELKPGLALLRKSIIDQHFIARKRLNRLISLAIENPDLFCVGIDEATALLVKGNSAEVLGLSQVITFRNAAKTSRSQTGRLGAKRIKMSIYLPGQTFKLPH